MKRRITTAILGVALALAAGGAHAATIDVTVSNESSREITGLYLAATAQSKWGPDQLNGVALAQGNALTLSAVACDATAIVVVAEDVAGCFAYQSIGCGAGGTWTLTNATVRDCGR